MFSYPQTLNPNAYGGADVSKVYDLIELGGTKSVSRVAATATTTPETLSIAHSSFKQNDLNVSRHLVRLDKTFVLADYGKQTLSAYLVIQVPHHVEVTTAEVQDIVGCLIKFEQDSGALAKLLNAEI